MIKDIVSPLIKGTVSDFKEFGGIKTHDIYIITGVGTNFFAYSLDNAETWITKIVENDYNTNGYYNGNKILLGGGILDSKVVHSENGINYICTKTALSGGVNALCYANGVWVAGMTGTDTLAYSENDGETWTLLGHTIFANGCYCLMWDGSKFWAGGGVAGNVYAWSNDGKIWTGKGGTSIFTNNVTGIACSGNIICMVGYDAAKSIAWSANGGVNWSTDNGAKIFSNNGNKVAYSPELDMWMFVGIGTDNTIAYAIGNFGTLAGLGKSVFTTAGYDIYWGKDKFILGGNGTHMIAYSLNGIDIVPYPDNIFTSYGRGGLYVPSSALLPKINRGIKDNLKLDPSIHFLGDSITYGTAASESDKKWTVLVCKNEQTYHFNYGVSGASITTLISVQLPLLVDKKVEDKYVFISIGVNNVRANTAVNTFMEGLLIVYNSLLLKGYNNTNIIIPTLFYFEDYGAGNLELLLSYNSAIETFWNTYNLVIRPDVYTNQGGHDSLAPDLLHPSNIGHANIAAYYDSILP